MRGPDGSSTGGCFGECKAGGAAAAAALEQCTGSLPGGEDGLGGCKPARAAADHSHIQIGGLRGVTRAQAQRPECVAGTGGAQAVSGRRFVDGVQRGGGLIGALVTVAACCRGGWAGRLACCGSGWVSAAAAGLTCGPVCAAAPCMAAQQCCDAMQQP